MVLFMALNMGVIKIPGDCKRCGKEVTSFDKDGWLCESCWCKKYKGKLEVKK